MVKCSRSKARLRGLVALPVLMAVALVTACDSDGPAFPSTAPVSDVLIQKVPAGAPFLIIETYGDSLRLLGVPVDADNRWVDVPVTYTSSRPQLAEIVTHTGADGRPYGVLRFAASPSYANPTNVDTLTVTATAGGHSSTVNVIVREDPRVDLVGVTAVTPFLVPGMELTLTATARDGFGNAIPAPNPWEWATSSEGVATVEDNQDGTATVTTVGEGSATITASVLNAGEPVETGVVSGSSTILVPSQLISGQQITVGVPDGGWGYWTVVVPPGTSSLVVQIGGSTSGDADLYVYSPGTVPTATNFVCRPFLVGSNETCTINNPAAGVWGVGINAWPGDGDVAGLQMTATVN
jgi:hypothetical protein